MGKLIRLGIVGCNYGRTVLLPAFRTDSRCEVVALGGTEKARTEQLAREANVAKAFDNWTVLVEDSGVDAVAIATPPRLQSAIAVRALQLGKPVFAEKPLAADRAGADSMLAEAARAHMPTMVDFEFLELPTWQRAKAMIEGGALGAIRHVIVAWNVENAATRLRLRNWKTQAADGGGVLGNFVSHCFFYLEWLCGPLAGLSARVSGPPDAPDLETTAMLSFSFTSDAVGSLAMSCASFLGAGHRIEIYGEAGTLVLVNTTTDYMRGFELLHARRPAEKLEPVAVANDPLDSQFTDGRVAPVARLAKRFLDAIDGKGQTFPSFADGLRVQSLIEAARQSNNNRCAEVRA